jgi:phosphate-selective porin OprO and OprP
MNTWKRSTLIMPSLLLVILFFSDVTAAAQENKSAGSASPASEPGKRESNDDIEQLKTQLKQLQLLIEQQQQSLLELRKRLDESTAKPTSAPALALDASAKLSPPPNTNSPVEPNKNPNSTTPATQKIPDKPTPVAGWEKMHAFLRSSDGAFETQIGGYGQLDFRGYQKGDHPPNSFFVRRARLSLEGKLERYFDFRIEGDFADTANTALRDFYVNIHRIDEFQLRFGQFRVPISQEEMRSDNLQDFVERSLVNNLVPSRSPGLGASGVINNGVFEYQIGAFNGKGLLAANNNGTPETALRLRFNPWKNGGNFLSKGFIFGGAFTQGRSLGGTSVRGQTESRSFSFFVPDTINGKYVRANGEFTWLLGPAVIRGEYDQTNQRRDNLGVGGRNLPGVVAKGYMGQFTYLLTGEEKPESGVLAPKHNLFADSNGKQGFGAWELKFRYANLQIADGTSKSNRAETFYFGPNWYMNRFVRYLLDIGYERFKDPIRSPRPGDNTFFVILSRVQVAF